MNGDEAARNEWWEGLSESDRNVWTANARSAGADAWALKKASIFDRDVSFSDLLRQHISIGSSALSNSSRLEEGSGMKFIRRDGTKVELDGQAAAFVAGGAEGSGGSTLELLSSAELRDLLEWARAAHVGIAEDEPVDLHKWPGWARALATHQSRIIVASMSMRELMERVARQ